MSYLDYLTTHTYDQLPEAVRTAIGAQEYALRRRFALELAGAPPTIPDRLLRAYHRQVDRRADGWDVRYWLVAASWLVTIAVTAAWFTHEPLSHYVQLPPRVRTEVVRLKDTIHKVVYEERLRVDTVFAPASPPPPPRMVVVHDTVYLPREYAATLSAAVPLNEASLSLLVGSSAD